MSTCMLTPIWGAARPTPGASRMAVTILATRSRSSCVPNMLSGTLSAFYKEVCVNGQNIV